MVAKFQFYLDGTLVTDPKGWADLDTTIKRDQELYSLLISQDAELEFFDNGYTYIKSVFDSQDFCSFIRIEIKQTCDQLNYETIFTGIIFLSEVKFSLMQCSVKVKTVDDGFYARINNNRSIKAKLNVGRSKNDTPITVAASIPVEFFTPSTGVYDAAPNHQPNVYTVYEVFKFLVAFMTDGLVDFVSTDFAPGGQWEGKCITIGNEVRLWDQSVIPELSFDDTFKEVNKKLRIAFAVERINGRPTLRIENAEYFYSQSSAVTLNDAKDVVLQMDTTQLYSQVHFGSSIFDDLNSPIGQFPESIDFVGFKDETFHIIGTCNIDRTLDLQSEWIISSNIIEDIFVNQVPDYDSDIILVDVTLGAPNQATQSNWLVTPPPYYYNEAFNNRNVAQNWLRGIPSSIAKFLGNADNSFQATLSANQNLAAINAVGNPAFGNVPYDDDTNAPNHDVNDNYNNTIPFAYVVPASGLYTFYAESRITSSGVDTSFATVSIQLMVQDNLGVPKMPQYPIINPSDAGVSTFVINTIQGGIHRSQWNNIIVNAGDRVSVQIFNGGSPYPDSVYTVKAGSLFACTKSATGGGIYDTIEPANYKIKKYNFKYPITFAQLNTIKSDTKKLITFTTNNSITKTGWIDTIKYYHHDKVAEVTLITNE